MKNFNYLLAFNPGQQLIFSSDDKMILNPHYVGNLNLTSGNLVVCDPLCYPDTPPLLPQLQPGNYPVILSLGWRDRYKFPTVVCAMLCLSQENPITWEIVVEANQESNYNCAKQLHEYSYPVDAGTSCFMDAVAAKAISDSYDCETNLGDLLINEFEKKENVYAWANMMVDEATGANIVAFESGLGDGCYGCDFGYNKEGNIVRVVTDFLFSVGTIA